jgi:hypothetical protein
LNGSRFIFQIGRRRRRRRRRRRERRRKRKNFARGQQLHTEIWSQFGSVFSLFLSVIGRFF